MAGNIQMTDSERRRYYRRLMTLGAVTSLTAAVALAASYLLGPKLPLPAVCQLDQACPTDAQRRWIHGLAPAVVLVIAGTGITVHALVEHDRV